MTRDECLARFPNASESFIAANCGHTETPVANACDRAPCSELEPNPVQAVAHNTKVKVSHPEKCLIFVESRRVSLQDPDNGVVKWHIDALRYAGIIPDDTTAEIELATTQTKVATKAEECTVITITPL